MTENPRSNPDFLVETKSSETPPPSTPDTRQQRSAGGRLFKAAEAGSSGRARRWRENGGRGAW